MDLRQLRTFCIVAEELNLTKAAERLHMTQPPLSRKIKTLEEELGSRLFIRGNQGLSLSATGQYLYDHAHQLFDKVESITKTIQRIERGEKPLLNIGFVPSVFHDQLPLFVRELIRKDEVELTLAELTTYQQVQALKSGRIDIGFGRLHIDDPDVVQEVLFEEPLIAALPESHPLAGTTPSLKDLAQFPLILFPAKRPSMADIIEKLFDRHNISIKVAQEANELQTALSLVAAGLGVTLVPEQVWCVQRQGICYVRLNDDSITTSVICSHRKGEENSPLIKELKTTLAHAHRAND